MEEEFVPTYKEIQISEEEKKKNQFQTQEEKIKEALRLKEQGNEFFKQKDYKNALKFYSKVFLFINGLVTEGDSVFQYAKPDQKLEGEDQIQIVNDLKCTTLLNMSQIDLYNGNFQKAVDRVTQSLKIKESVKGYYRRGCAYLETNDLDLAKEDFNKVIKMNPEFTEIKEKLQILKQKQKILDQKQGKIYKNMFGNSQQQ